MSLLLLGAGLGADVGGGGPWTPTSLATASPLWFDASDAITITTATGISAWSNKGSLGGSLTQGTGASQPTWPAAVLNGLHVARFDGSAQRIFTASSVAVPSTTTMTIMAVFQRNPAGGYRGLLGSGLGASSGTGITVAGNAGEDWLTGDVMVHGDGTTSGRAPRAITSGAGALVDAAFHVARFDLGTTVDVYADGTAVTLRASAPGSFPGVTASFAIGDTTPTEGAYWPGDVAEVVFAPNATPGEKQKLEGYLAWKWGLQANLPGGHIYAGAAP